MGEIRVNDIIYGTSFASGVTCDDNETVQEKLSNAAYIDIENEEIGDIPRGDCLYTTDIIDNLESESDTHVLSAKQGKILNEKIENGLHDVVDNLESTATDKALSANQGRILNEKIDNFDLSDFGLDMELTQAEYDNLRNLNQIDPQITYFITDANIDDITSKNFNGNISDFFSISKDYMVGDYCIFNNQLYEFIENKPAGDWDESKVKTITIKEKINVLKSDLEIANTNLSTLETLVNSLNETVSYIEENLGALTTEEYTCSGTVSFSGDWYNTFTKDVIFDRIFVEPPAVGTVITYLDGEWDTDQALNITTTGCTISVGFHDNSYGSCTVQWTAHGLVRKQIE